MKFKNIYFKEVFLNFLFYCVIGWIYEVFLEVVVYRWGFSNRGVLFGPYLPIYGTGAMIFLILLSNLKSRKITIGRINLSPFLVFLGIVFITTLLELAGSYVMEYTKGDWLWNYEDYFLNFQGRVALNPSIRFGLGGMVIMYGLQPLFEKWISKLNPKVINILFIVLFALFLLDVAIYFLK
ncbi:putative ABC transporter permease [Anaerosphaera multitolerans]|uniref:ABC transporter permease n=1 Tax=Anaerosphaera multitolerans TaxID=2487351 RepID=A0A437S9N4_9FIRM|nr:putative ABC transporter permease [Anaerosphaera multitolerans]RVU55527.1 hypothetical protein EF514_02020 [Anaerosphaera multitolerans]